MVAAAAPVGQPAGCFVVNGQSFADSTAAIQHFQQLQQRQQEQQQQEEEGQAEDQGKVEAAPEPVPLPLSRVHCVPDFSGSWVVSTEGLDCELLLMHACCFCL